jgi:hypothetical protein
MSNMNLAYSEPPSFSTLSTRFVKCTVSAQENGLLIDPTTGTIEFAFMADSVEPASLNWKTGSWEIGLGEYLGRCLVGPSGTITLAASSYDVWVRYTKAPETIIEKIGYLVIY